MSAPKRVYLQWGEELPGAPDPYLDEVTWTPERAGPEDVEYVHVAEVERLTADLAAARSLTDSAYAERNQVVAAMAKMALALGWSAGTARTDIEGWEPEWQGCVYIDLPTGQASWHYHDREAHLFADLPPYPYDWDTHTTSMKYDRLAALDAGQELAAARAERDQLAELVDDLTLQSTYGIQDEENGDGVETFDSGAISAFADGLRDMARRGKVRVTHDVGRRVIAVFTDEELARQEREVEEHRERFRAALAALPTPPEEQA